MLFIWFIWLVCVSEWLIYGFMSGMDSVSLRPVYSYIPS